MRLPIERVKEAILHPEKDVRTEVVFFFSHSFSVDPTIMPLAIQAIERYGWDEAFEHYTFFRDLVQTDDTVRWLIEQLQQWQPTAEDTSDRRRQNLQSALMHADPVLLQPYASQIIALNALDDEGSDAVAEQLDIRSQSPDQLWGALDTLCALYQDDDEIPRDMFDFAERIVKQIAKYPEQATERVLATLRRESDESEEWTIGFAARLAGEMRLDAAVPTLVSLLHDSGDWLQDEISAALAKIGTPLVVANLTSEFPNSAWEFRLAAACILERIHSDLSVHACLDMLSGEEDHVIRCHLLQSALMNFATEAIEPARQYVLSTTKDPDLLEVRHCLLLVCKLTGERIPEFDAWLDDSRGDQEFRRKWYADHPFVCEQELAELNDELQIDTWLEDGLLLPDDEAEPVPLTVVRRPERVGRNDPCPCGSGKKFKKCCYGQSSLTAETDLNHAAAMSQAQLPQAGPRYPIGTVVSYGPDDQRTTKIVAAVIKRQGAEPILQRWVGTKVKDDPKIQRRIQEFFHKHQVQSIVASDGNMGCPHEEGQDFPIGEDCPFCPFWKGKQGTARSP